MPMQTGMVWPEHGLRFNSNKLLVGPSTKAKRSRGLFIAPGRNLGLGSQWLALLVCRINAAASDDL